MVELAGLGKWWFQLGSVCGGVDGVDQLRIVILVSNDEFMEEIGRAIRRLLSCGDVNH